MKDETRKMVLRIEAKGQTQVILGSYTKKKKKIMANLMMEVEESEELRMTHIVNFENSGTIHERMKEEEHLSLCVSWGKREW